MSDNFLHLKIKWDNFIIQTLKTLHSFELREKQTANWLNLHFLCRQLLINVSFIWVVWVRLSVFIWFQICFHLMFDILCSFFLSINSVFLIHSAIKSFDFDCRTNRIYTQKTRKRRRRRTQQLYSHQSNIRTKKKRENWFRASERNH